MMALEPATDMMGVLRRLTRPGVVLAMAGGDYALFQGADRRRRLRTVAPVLAARLMALGHVQRTGTVWALSGTGRNALAQATVAVRQATQRWVMDADGVPQTVTVMIDHDALAILATRYARAGHGFTARARAAGEQLMADSVLAGFHGGLTACDWGRIRVDGGGQGADMPERRLDARRRVMTALKGLDGAARGAVIAVCVSQQSVVEAADGLGFDKRAFRIALMRGLEGVADCYGV